MPNRLLPSAVVFAKDVTRLARFYAQVIGMAEVASDAQHVVLGAEGFQLVVHGIPAAIARQIEITSPPELREETALKICLPVESIAAARAYAAALGGGVQAARAEWTARGFRACDGHDPEGNIFQVREAAA
jgi:predicted enzyme related to lactoylglutathione lyase